MRRGFTLIWLGATALVSALVGVLSYQAGWAAGLATKLPAGAAVPYYYPPHFGFGFFGLLPFLFLLFVLLLVFRGGRRWGPGGRGRFPSGPSASGDPWHGWPQQQPAEQRPPAGQDPPPAGRTQA
jgi:hypothetical protein